MVSSTTATITDFIFFFPINSLFMQTSVICKGNCVFTSVSGAPVPLAARQRTSTDKAKGSLLRNSAQST